MYKKYGPEEGLNRWKERQEKWLKSFVKSNYSKISQILFKQIFAEIKNDFKHIYFATSIDNEKNNEFRLMLNERLVLPDFYISDNKKIIEFDGVYWHKQNPENKKKQKIRDNLIILNGYQIMHVKENDYYKNPIETIKKCIDFIYEKTN